MIETELEKQIEFTEKLRIERLPPETSRETGRAYRRLKTRQKAQRLYMIVTSSYIPHVGYVEHSFDGFRNVPTGKYVKHAKNSNCQRWMKRATSQTLRHYQDVPKKGNLYRRLFDYWWALY